MATIGYSQGPPGQRSSDSPGGNWGLRLGGLTAWTAAAVLVLAIVGFLGLVAGYAVGMFGGVFIVFFLAIGLRRTMRTVRGARGLAVLGYLESAVRLNLPLGFYLRAAAAGEEGKVHHRLMALVSGLESGVPLGEALQRDVPEVSRRTAAALAAAEGVGQLQPALTRLYAEGSGDAAATQPDQALATAYPLTICFACGALILFVLIFVLPRFQEIFQDYKTPLPWLTQEVISAGGFLVDNMYLAFALVLAMALLILVYLGRTMREVFTPWWPSFLVGRLTDYLSWHVPVWRALQRHRALGEICQFISDAVRAGAPLPDALAGASGLHMNASIRKPLVEWRQGLLQGAPVGRAAAVAGMPAMLVGFLDAATVPGKNAAPDELAAVMEFLARHYRVRFSHLAAVIATAVEPAVTLCLAVLVGTIVVALILPLAKLQRSVEAYGPGGFM